MGKDEQPLGLNQGFWNQYGGEYVGQGEAWFYRF
jgi:hypothetical protein